MKFFSKSTFAARKESAIWSSFRDVGLTFLLQGRDVLVGDGHSRGHYNQPFRKVFQLPDVTRPVMAHQDGSASSVILFSTIPFPLGKILQKSLYQKGNIFFSFPKGRNTKWNDI